ncbi:hypothetical protein [Oecophyllibacter saccharovorans]|uniref:hypothetical protein n=1 Tax=Oecophyllibacter saccharovorans TaxID=2558360 RepID=UPI001F5024A6|nr:hypothetical protein [Oecophyllibacter saccharovorans]
MAGIIMKEIYLAPCCRNALHRLKLAGAHGRPALLEGQPRTRFRDEPCLGRLVAQGLARKGEEGTYYLTRAGAVWHERLFPGFSAPV